MSHSIGSDEAILPIQDGSSATAQDSDNIALELDLADIEKPELQADSLLVDWDGPDDVSNPVNWPA
jgi:hypothetical protein